jgi:hypothetical protein
MLIYRPPTKADDPPATIAFIFPQKNTAWTASSWVFRGTVWQIGYNDCLLHYKCTRKLSVKNDGKIGSSEHLYEVKQSHNTSMKAQGKSMYSSYSFTNAALDGGGLSASRPFRALPPKKGTPVPILQEAGWVPEPVWTQRLKKKSFCLCRGSNSIARSYSPLSNPILTELLRLLNQCILAPKHTCLDVWLRFSKLNVLSSRLLLSSRCW